MARSLCHAGAEGHACGWRERDRARFGVMLGKMQGLTLHTPYPAQPLTLHTLRRRAGSTTSQTGSMAASARPCWPIRAVSRAE